jgi:hypothetical protein
MIFGFVGSPFLSRLNPLTHVGDEKCGAHRALLIADVGKKLVGRPRRRRRLCDGFVFDFFGICVFYALGVKWASSNYAIIQFPDSCRGSQPLEPNGQTIVAAD